MTECEDCKRRREAILAAARKMADWVKRPIGRPPIDIKQTPISGVNAPWPGDDPAPGG